MPARIADLVHGLVVVVLGADGSPSTTTAKLCGDREPVREPGALPEGRYELHYFGDGRAAKAFRSGLALAGSNAVEALPSEDPASGAVLVRFVDDRRTEGVTLDEAVPLVSHADVTSQVVRGRWSRMQDKLFSVSPSPSSTVKSIGVVEERPDAIHLRVRYGPWAYYERRRRHESGPEAYFWLVGDSDRHRIELRFDRHEDRHVKAVIDVVRADLSDLAVRHGGRLRGDAVTFLQPDDLVAFLRGLESFAEALSPIYEKAASAAMRRDLLADKAACRVVERMRKGARLDVGAKVALVDPDGRRTEVSYALFGRLRTARLVRREDAEGRVFVRKEDPLAGDDPVPAEETVAFKV